MVELLDFLSNPGGVGIIALALLGVIYLVKEVVSFFQDNLFPQWFKWRLERRKLALPYAEKVLDREWQEPAFFRRGLPKYADFKEGYVLIRPEVEIVKSKLKSQRFAHIEGPPSSGKSVIALTVAYQQLREGRTVIYFNRPSSIPEGLFENISLSLRNHLDKEKVLMILDDVHLDIGLASKLFIPIYGQLENARLLFVSRPLGIQHGDEFEGWQYVFPQYMPSVPVDANYAIKHLPDFYCRKKYGKQIAPVAKSIFVNECGNDLLLLGRYLSEWDGSSSVALGSLRQAVSETIRDDLERLKRFAPDAVRAFLVLGVFYRFEIGVEREFLESLGIDISYLSHAGEVRVENGFVTLYHSSLAKLYSNAIRRLAMPDYVAFSSRYSPFPLELFKEYVHSQPRNLPEMISGLRDATEMLGELLEDRRLTESFRKCLEREQSLTTLGTSIARMRADHRAAAWHILKEVDFRRNAAEISRQDDPREVTEFLLNLSELGDIKLREWIDGVPTRRMVRILSGASLGNLVHMLRLINRTHQECFDDIVQRFDLSLICEKFLEEESLENLKESLLHLPAILPGRIDVRAGSRPDFTGEWSTKVSLYVENHRVTRVMPGRRLGIPHSQSDRTHALYSVWLFDNRRYGAAVTLDDGAEKAVLNNDASLFPVGICEVEGSFEKQAIVTAKNTAGEVIGAGISNYSSRELDLIKGLRSPQISQAHPTIAADRVFDDDLFILKDKLQRLTRHLKTD
jgi:hypothetical protein